MYMMKGIIYAILLSVIAIATSTTGWWWAYGIGYCFCVALPLAAVAEGVLEAAIDIGFD